MSPVFGVIQLIKMRVISSIPKEKIFGAYIRYVKFRKKMAPEWITIKHSGSQGACYNEC